MVNRKNCSNKIILILVITPLIMANFSAQTTFASEELDNKQVESIKIGLDIAKLFINLSLDESSLKAFLNTLIQGGTISTDITYGILVLSSLNEVEMIDMVLSQDYKTKGTAYFNQILDERLNLFSYWKGVGLDLPKVLGDQITGPMAALSLNTFCIINKTIQIFTAFENLRLIKLYDGLWTYFDIRMHHGSHEEAWNDTKYIIGWAANNSPLSPSKLTYTESLKQLEYQFSKIWENYGTYITPWGLSKDFKQKVKNDLQDTISTNYSNFLALEQYEKEHSSWNKLVGNTKSLLDELNQGIRFRVESIAKSMSDLFSDLGSLSPASLVEIPETNLPDYEEKVGNNIEELSFSLSETAETIDEETLIKFQKIIQEAAKEIETLSKNKIFKGESTEKATNEIYEEEENAELEEKTEEEQKGIDAAEIICDKNSLPGQNKVIFNEIAWMGTEVSNNNEWIELKNISGQDIDLTGWRVISEGEQINITFREKIVLSNGFFLLERTSDDSVLNIPADLIYKGALKNDNEALYIFDNNCLLQDVVSDLPQWNHGDNKSKQTMERKTDLGWQTSKDTGGTPRAESSEGYKPMFNYGSPAPIPLLTPPSQENSDELEIVICSPTTDTPNYSPILMNEIAWMGTGSSSAAEWIELKNTSTSTISMDKWQLIGKNTEDGKEKITIFFDQTDTIEPLSFFLLERTSDDSVPGILAERLFAGAINDSNFRLELFNEQCSLIDKTGASSLWPAGEKTPERRTMERKTDLSWQSSPSITSINSLFGTPKSENAQIIEENTPIGEENPLVTIFTFFPEEPRINEEVVFDATLSGDDIINYAWNFDDGTQEASESSTTTHYFINPGEYFVKLEIINSNNATSSATSSINILDVEVPSLEVTINEIAWMGTSATNPQKEWIELYNNTISTINLTGWSLASQDGGPEIVFSTSSIDANSYFLIERTDEETTNIESDYIVSFGNGLKNTGERLELRNASSTLIDIVDCSSGWFAGNDTKYLSMERIDSTATGSIFENWHSNNIVTRNGKDSCDNRVNGTPRAINSVSQDQTEIYTANINQAFDDFEEIPLGLLGSPYLFTYDLQVPLSKKLSIEPGVILRFDENVVAEIDGTLKANGEEDRKIIFTGVGGNKWKGIVITSQESITELNHCEVNSTVGTNAFPAIAANSSLQFNNSRLENFGEIGLIFTVGESSSTVCNSVFLGNSSSSSKAISIRNGNPIIKDCLFENNLNGIFIDNNEHSPIIENNIFSKNDVPINIINTNPILKGNKSTNDNFINGIVLIGTIFNTSPNSVWFYNEMPYIIDRFLTVLEKINLIIEPGVVVKFRSQTYLQIKGSINIKGEDSNPVVFTSIYDDLFGDTLGDGPLESLEKGIWGGLSIESGKKSTINNLIIKHGGWWNQYWQNWGQISALGADIEINNVFSSYALEAGIDLEDCTSSVKNSHLEENKVGLKISGKEPILDNNIYSGNQRDDIYWPYGGEPCTNLKLSNPELEIECGCCPY
jgi:hypothetical protein